MSFVLFAFLLLFECIKPFGIGLFARTAPALAHLLVLLLLELQRLLRFGADADLRGLPSGFPLCCSRPAVSRAPALVVAPPFSCATEPLVQLGLVR